MTDDTAPILLVTLPATYNNGKTFRQGSAALRLDADGTFSVTVVLADGSTHTVYDGLVERKRAQARVDDINTIEE